MSAQQTMQTKTYFYTFNPATLTLSIPKYRVAYDPDQLVCRLNLTAGTFNQLGQYTNSPGRVAKTEQDECGTSCVNNS